jgi:glycosyltransferase involved in cell wall biosynthesis
MRLVVDLQSTQTESRFRGIGRYSLAFAKSLARLRGNNELLVVLNGTLTEGVEDVRSEFRALLPSNGVRVFFGPSRICVAHGGSKAKKAAAKSIWSSFLSNLQPDLIHVSSIFEGFGCDAVTSISKHVALPPLSATLYDLIPLSNRKEYLDVSRPYCEFYEEKLTELRKCDLLLAISEYSRRQAIDLLSLASDRVVNVGAAVEPQSVGETAVANAARNGGYPNDNRGISKPFILYTGGADPRKNLPRLIAAYGKLTADLRSKFQLVICGKIPIAEQLRLKTLAQEGAFERNDVVFVGYVNEVELNQLYSTCSLFVLPSLEEGFGLPALEAMTCGAPVIAGNNSSLPEVIGLDDALFDATSTFAISEKMTEALCDNEFRRTLVNNAHIQSRKFSWDKTAEIAWNAFLDLHRLKRTPNDIACRVSALETCELIARDHEAKSLKSKDINEIAQCIDRNIAKANRIQRLFVDISELIQRDAGTGVQRVTRSILAALIESGVAGFRVTPVYATLAKPGYRFVGDEIRKFGLVSDGEQEGELIDVRQGDVFIGLDLQHHVVAAQIPFLEFAKCAGASVNFVVYDLLPIQFPEFFPVGVASTHQKWIENIASFSGLFCISKAVADDLREWMCENTPERIAKCRVDWFPLGADIENVMGSRGLPPEVPEILNLLKKSPSFLMVGTIEPRKGHIQTLDAFEILWKRGLDIVLCIAGREGWQMTNFIHRVKGHPEFGKKLLWIHDASDELIQVLYKNCTALVAASYGEGFGLPLIEAARHGIPVIARDIPVFREVGGQHASYFSARQPDEMAEFISRWIERCNIDRNVRPQAVSVASWRESASTLIRKILS